MKFPATKLVHWPSGPVKACDRHARQLVKTGEIMGFVIGTADLVEPGECGSCITEAKVIADLEVQP